MRFRKEKVAILADIQQMFHCFLVREDHRNYLRFLWYRDNDVTKEIIDYRMKVHVFGNSPSPAVAIYGGEQLERVHENMGPTQSTSLNAASMWTTAFVLRRLMPKPSAC